MKLRFAFRAVGPFLGGIATLVLLVFLLAAMYFTWLDLQWTAFLAGILAASVMALASRNAHSEWRIARRDAQLAQVRQKLAAEGVLRRHAEEGLAGARGNIEYLDDKLPALVCWADAEGKLRFHNHAFRAFDGRPRGAIDGHPLPEALASGWGALEPGWREALAGRLAAGIREHALASGARLRLAWHWVPHFGADGRVEGACLIQVDVTELRHGLPEVAAMPAPPAPAPAACLPPAPRAVLAATLNEEITGWDNVGDRLRAALENDEFCLYAQRIEPLSPAAHRLPFHELLVRLREEEDNLMPPGTFLPLAEEHGLMPALDRWVVRHVLDWAAADPGRRQAVYSVNLSPATIDEGGLPAFVREALDARGLPGAILCFELPEADCGTRTASLARFIAGAQAAGCTTAFSGFGHQLEAFDLLRDLAVDYLKIDPGIVLRLATSPVDLAKLKAIVRVARDTRRLTIAQCVEDAQTRERLSALGVDYAQGFGVARPEPLEGPGRAGSGAPRQDMCWPPLIEMLAPVMKAASSEAR